MIIDFRDFFNSSHAQLVEIWSQEEQDIIVNIVKEVENHLVLAAGQYFYWWTGLKDINDDGNWFWDSSKYFLIIQYFIKTTQSRREKTSLY